MDGMRTPKDWMVSTAHEWLQRLPLSDNTLICNRCKHEVIIGDYGKVLCFEHYEDKRAGFKS